MNLKKGLVLGVTAVSLLSVGTGLIAQSGAKTDIVQAKTKTRKLYEDQNIVSFHKNKKGKLTAKVIGRKKKGEKVKCLGTFTFKKEIYYKIGKNKYIGKIAFSKEYDKKVKALDKVAQQYLDKSDPLLDGGQAIVTKDTYLFVYSKHSWNIKKVKKVKAGEVLKTHNMVVSDTLKYSWTKKGKLKTKPVLSYDFIDKTGSYGKKYKGKYLSIDVSAVKFEGSTSEDED